MADSGGSRRNVDRRPPPLPGTASGTASGTAGTAPGPTGPTSAEPPTSPSTRKQPPHRDLRTGMRPGITARTTVSPPSSSVPCPTDVTPLPPPTVSPEPGRSAAPPRHSTSSTTNRPCPDPGLQPLHELAKVAPGDLWARQYALPVCSAGVWVQDVDVERSPRLGGKCLQLPVGGNQQDQLLRPGPQTAWIGAGDSDQRLLTIVGPAELKGRPSVAIPGIRCTEGEIPTKEVPGDGPEALRHAQPESGPDGTVLIRASQRLVQLLYGAVRIRPRRAGTSVVQAPRSRSPCPHGECGGVAAAGGP
ncbi:hypothetical protein J2S51_007096 [Streptomyces sp. DSM 41269]|nr:hypothetical protein [Streptomyces sp. DSM 41269]MDP9954258.1 hypothetical protein [Streptomyces sp. DSM 41269]